MVETTHFDGKPEKVCKSSLGHYFVPKSLIGVKVESNVANDRQIAVFGPIPKPDIDQTYCLDYLASGTSNDQVWVDRTEDGLLETVRANADDQTHVIARTIIRAIFALVTGAPQTAIAGAELTDEERKATRREVFSAEYDPFDPMQIISVNVALRKLGYCLVLEREVFETSVAKQYSSFCEDPGRATLKGAPHLEIPGDMTARTERPPADIRAIFYRPRLTYSLVLLEKPNLAARGGWEVRKRAKVMLENVSPLVALRVDRTYFAQRQTILRFSEGALTNAVINKGGEALGFMSIPLELATAIASVPATLFQVRINQANNELALKNAQKALLDSRLKYLDQLQAYQATKGVPGG